MKLIERYKVLTKDPKEIKKEFEENKVQTAEAPYTGESKTDTEDSVSAFFTKYGKGNAIMQVLCKDLAAISSDIQWIIESEHQNEQFAIDFEDALNSLSVKF